MTSNAGDRIRGRAHKDDIFSSLAGGSDHGSSLEGVHDDEEEEEEDNRQRLAQMTEAEMVDEDQDDTFATAFSTANTEAETAQMVEEETLPPEPDSMPSVGTSISSTGPDDTPSLRDSPRSSSRHNVSDFRAGSRMGLSPSPLPFDRRFTARVSSSSSVPRAIAPAFLTPHSRQVSISSQLTLRSQEDEVPEKGTHTRPWEVVRWTRLKKISQQAFSESGRRAFGQPTYLTIGASIAVGTAKGIILLFDYQQNLKSIVGQGTLAAESGAITSLAISADHSTIAAGHATGSIFTWELTRPATPFLHIQPLGRPDGAGRTYDGHLRDSAILHIGFLGQRHTAIASADDSGMSFSHLATRGLGALGRSVKTTRILGRYPDLSQPDRKPSSVLAFSTLPLGNVAQVTDDFGLTALLTPYLLVIISTTPFAQTQYKASRLKDIAAHSAMTGCLAWFPAVRLKDASTEDTSKTKLVYCWSNVVNVLEVRERKPDELRSTEKRAELDFVSCGRWTCEEAILSVQWLSRSILALLTITQRLIILEDKTFRVADSADLNSKHIHHADMFSRQLQPLVDKIEQGDAALHGVLPDAYHMSFKAYKGRLFLLGQSDVSMGTLSNWADRLAATLEAGNPITAVELALSYYTGKTDRVTIGLPDGEHKRHAMVRPKLLDLLTGSLNFILNDDTNRNTESGLRNVLKDFAEIAFRACDIIDERDLLFDQIYESYSDASMQDVFLFELEHYILESKIDLVPPSVLKDLLIWYESLELGDQLQSIICSLQTITMDIDQTSDVCKRMRLYDALIYVWNQALDDYITPLIDLMSLPADAVDTTADNRSQPQQTDAAMKIFPYMAYSLTGRHYPSGEDLTADAAFKAKSSVYSYLFSPTVIRWPATSGKQVIIAGMETSTSYPYLHYLLSFEPFSFLSMLNEAFEDSYLSDDEDQPVNAYADQDRFGALSSGPITRQRIVNIMLEVVGPSAFTPEDKILLDIFLARNLARFHQDILLSISSLRQILIELCQNPSDDLRDECQLSVEYLLTVYKPSDTQELIDLLKKACYYKALKSAYRSSQQYAKLLQTFFDDPQDEGDVFTCIRDCLRTGSGLSKRQAAESRSVVVSHASQLVAIDSTAAALTLEMYAPELLDTVFESAVNDSYAQFVFLQALLERSESGKRSSQDFKQKHREQYMILMCRHRPHHLADYVTLVGTADLRLDSILSEMESNNVVDAAIILLQHDGLARSAMIRLTNHLDTLRSALVSILNTESPDVFNTEEAIQDLLQECQKYVKLGIWLCQSEALRDVDAGAPSPGLQKGPKLSFEYNEEDLSALERLWLDLLDSTISIHQALPSTTTDPACNESSYQLAMVASTSLRDLIQSTFTAVLAACIPSSTSSTSPAILQASSQPPTLSRQRSHATPRFPPLLSTLLTRLSRHTSSMSTVLPLLSTLLSSHAFESNILNLARQFLDKDVYALLEQADSKRRKGWRPAGRGCDVCGRRCWGPGAGVQIWDAWRDRQIELRARQERRSERHVAQQRSGSQGKDKGKGRAIEVEADAGREETTDVAAKEERAEGLVVFSCSHLFHRGCLESTTGHDRATGSYSCPLCM